MSDFVWYVAYGSNLSRARFDIYLKGGTPEGTTHEYPGCRDPSDPLDDRPYVIEDWELAFGGSSKTWGGGVAFARRWTGGTLRARLYLVTHEQFCDIVAQENWLDPGSLDLDNDQETIGDHMYGAIPFIGTFEKWPMRAVSQRWGTTLNRPSPEYAAHIVRGLAESHAMSQADIDRYLRSAAGWE